MQRRAALAIALALFSSLVSAAGAARADAAPDPECVPDLELCVECSGPDGTDEGRAAADRCAQEAMAKGLARYCDRFDEKRQIVYYCGSGDGAARVNGHGCAGCAVSSGQVTDALLGLALVAAIILSRRRSHP